MLIAPTREQHEPLADDPPAPPTSARTGRLEMGVALAGFAAFCVLVLTKGSRLLEPDDYAYRASIVALSQGHLLLTTAQYEALSRQLGGIAQWVQLPGGRWISEKNPGYPFLAVAFQWLGALRLAPLFYGGLGCAGLYAGGRRWLGRWGGTFAVLLFCTSGAAITFAWRATMPTFTDASLVAAGAGALLWAMLAQEAPPRRRLAAGLAGFVALEAATFVRYTDAVELAVAVVVLVALARPARLPRRMVLWCLATVALFAAGVLVFDALVYGSPLKTGYGAGEITFGLSAVLPNLAHMPAPLVEAMPMVLPALAALAWIAVRLAKQGGSWRHGEQWAARRLDGVVALSLVAGWAGIWGLYLAYTWTVNQGGANAVHVIRFYLPALGLIALLGAWTLVRLPKVASFGAAVVALVLGVLSFHGLTAAGGLGPGLGPGRLPGGRPGVGRPPGFGGGIPGGIPGSGPPPEAGAGQGGTGGLP